MKTTVLGEVSDALESRIRCVLFDLFQALLGSYHSAVIYMEKKAIVLCGGWRLGRKEDGGEVK